MKSLHLHLADALDRQEADLDPQKPQMNQQHFSVDSPHFSVASVESFLVMLKDAYVVLAGEGGRSRR